jgi:hypothetical protein
MSHFVIHVPPGLCEFGGGGGVCVRGGGGGGG